MALTELDKKYWLPIQSVMHHLHQTVIKPTDKVLEIGPGTVPLARADVSVDFIDRPGVKNLVKCDVDSEPLPFKDKEFDFIYARHLVEDLDNPFLMLKEMSRVGKAGYIETPSPICEIGRGVDGSSPPYRGFYHHRFICWTFGQEFRLVGKYPLLEYLRIDETPIDQILKTERYWNSYYLWNGEITFNRLQAPINFDMQRDYSTILSQAVDASKESTDIFFSTFSK